MPAGGTSREAMEHEHTPEAIRHRLEHERRPSYTRDWVYGGIDGAVTTFAIVAGSIGASLPANVVITLGVANLVADGFSMAASNYSGTKAEHEEWKRLDGVERRHIRNDPDGEREEVRQIFATQGFADADLERAVEIVTADEKRWVETMLVHEYGLAPELRSPMRSAVATFIAFSLCGVVPLIPYLTTLPAVNLVAAAATGAVFFAIGSMKSRVSTAHWFWSGMETLLIGSAAAGVAWGIGRLLA